MTVREWLESSGYSYSEVWPELVILNGEWICVPDYSEISLGGDCQVKEHQNGITIPEDNVTIDLYAGSGPNGRITYHDAL